MKQVNIEVRGGSIKRYVMIFCGKAINSVYDSYFSVEVQSSDCKTAYDKITENPNKQYSYEVCLIEQPDIMKYYKLKERGYVKASEVFTKLADILARYNAIQKGTPVCFQFEEFGTTQTRIVMNAGLKNALEFDKSHIHFQTALALWGELSQITVDQDDEIESDWQHFEKGTCRFDIWHWFENTFGYPISLFMGVC
jgi:hypothetical protein